MINPQKKGNAEANGVSHNINKKPRIGKSVFMLFILLKAIFEKTKDYLSCLFFQSIAMVYKSF